MGRDTNKKDSIGKRALIFPAMAKKISDRQVFFLISSFQVDEIIDNVPVSSVPFSGQETEGIADWRDRIMPVIRLEHFLGIQPEGRGMRMLVVRAQDNRQIQTEGLKGIIRVGTGIRNVSMPIPCAPVKPEDWFSSTDMVKGAFDWENSLLVVPDVRKILNGKKNMRDSMSGLIEQHQ